MGRWHHQIGLCGKVFHSTLFPIGTPRIVREKSATFESIQRESMVPEMTHWMLNGGPSPKMVDISFHKMHQAARKSQHICKGKVSFNAKDSTRILLHRKSISRRENIPIFATLQSFFTLYHRRRTLLESSFENFTETTLFI